MYDAKKLDLRFRRPGVARARRLTLGLLPVVALLICVTSMPACSSLSTSTPDSWTGSYFQNPDRVWAAILETLIDLDYEVAESNREDGTLRTAPHGDEEGANVVLSINQVMHTMDQVNVYVKPSAGDGGGAADPGVLKAAADQFKAALDKKLQE